MALTATPAQAVGDPTWDVDFNRTGDPNPRWWSYDLGKWPYNGETETYTDDNAVQADGQLVLTARSDRTSARLVTRGKFTASYGTVQARMKVPTAQGIWPSIWMLGENEPTDGWPRCGEIDIFENIGESNRVYGTMHGPDRAGNHKQIGTWYDVPGGDIADTWHVYGVTWTPYSLSWSVDGVTYQTVTRERWEATGGEWVWDRPFYLVTNIAIGGDWPGYPDSSTSWPQQMTIDWIRFYRL